jgi:hypothetical protein
MKAKVFFVSACVCLSLLSSAEGRTHSVSSDSSGQAARKTAEADYVTFDLSDFTSAAEDCRGRLVKVTAEVVSVDASRQLIRLYDARARKMLDVSIAGLPKASRRSLLHEPVMRASILGRVELRNSHLMIDAHKVIALVAEPLAQSVVSE